MEDKSTMTDSKFVHDYILVYTGREELLMDSITMDKMDKIGMLEVASNDNIRTSKSFKKDIGLHHGTLWNGNLTVSTIMRTIKDLNLYDIDTHITDIECIQENGRNILKIDIGL